MSKIKSVMPVRAHGSNNNGNWVIRVRLTTGEELFAGINSNYNLAQAQSFIINNRLSQGIEFENTVMNNYPLGLPDAPMFSALIEAVKISAC